MPMRIYLRMPSILKKIIPWSWALVWFIIPFSLKGSVLSIGLFGLLIIMQLIIKRPALGRQHLFILSLPIILFVWYFFTASMGEDFIGVLKYMERKAALLLIPLIMLMAVGIDGVDGKWAMRGSIGGLVISGVIMLGRAIFLIFQGAGMDEWTYHALIISKGIGAIYYSWFLAIAIIYLLYRQDDIFLKRYRYPFLFLFSVLLLMASSKLFIVLTVPLTIWKLIAELKKPLIRLVAIIFLSVLVLAGSIPFLQRVQEIKPDDFEVVSQEQFEYDTPFNGVTLRLLQWRFGHEIVEEQNAWVLGTGPENSQKLLNEKYKEYNVYTGDPEWNSTGYLNYNFHNQYVETTVGTGFPGLLLLLFIFIYIIFISRKMLIFPLPVYIFTSLFFITESVLERQVGIILFCLLLCTLKPIAKGMNAQIR